MEYTSFLSVCGSLFASRRPWVIIGVPFMGPKLADLAGITLLLAPQEDRLGSYVVSRCHNPTLLLY